ncbi:TetR/AcrR family transcriptional regulator [Heyndrickxia acidicola]|uniref:TetR/AcrR family transcriptional regulator n=1 Tax=Heyndrickxia acidicola TaxID=209389 RepID=A0ABU6MKI5_9BACI|nr:TetR/AcrR family transcriptional regulator [Heyndrickxia acidicola]MED1203565.1 TetR/AcrR family transcriptional regulator [Heyndrickxia acidicola]
MRKISPEERITMRQTYIQKILNTIRTQGFMSLTIQDIAQLMNISRATLYNYFSSKEDVMMEVTNYCISYIHKADKTISDESLSYPYRLQKVFEQAVFSAIYASDIFLHDLQTSCTLLYEKKMKFETNRMATIRSFYQKGMDKGIFNTLNPAILIMQDEVSIRKMLTSSFLIEEGLTLRQALSDYYEAKKVQVLKSEALEDADNEKIHLVIENIVNNITTI